MRIIALNNRHEVKIFASAKEMTIERYTAFQRFLLLESGVGSSIESVSEHFTKLHSFLASNRNQEAKKEAENLHFNFHAVLNQINYQSYAFACMVHSIDGEKIEDISEDNLKLILKQLSDLGLTAEASELETEAVKKKFSTT